MNPASIKGQWAAVSHGWQRPACRILRPVLRGLVIAAAAGAALHAPAYAQQSGDAGAAASTSRAPDGHIIYSRDVSYGSAIGPRTPGRVNTVNAGPTDLIVGSLAIGLEPIGDEENASIIAGTNSQTALIGGQIGLGLGALNTMNGSGGTAANVGNMQGSVTGGAIGHATGAIRDAMGSLRGVLGGGQ